MNIFRYPRDKNLLEKKLSPRTRLYDRGLLGSIGVIFDQVAKDGDRAVRELTERFDSALIESPILSDEKIEECVLGIPESLRAAIDHCRTHIEEVNRQFLPSSNELVEIRKGTYIGERYLPLDSVGLWVPARKGPLISTALMLVGAAKVAGVQRIVVGMAPKSNGEVDEATVAAARIAGATDIVVGNGVGIIAGFSMGTESIPEVDGIFGPGPGGIAAAMATAFSYGKKTVLGVGPTDSLIICDETADPLLLAHDLLNEAEHGPDSSSILLTTSSSLASEVVRSVKDILDISSGLRHETLSKVLSDDGMVAVIVCDDFEEAIDFANWYAPEHMIVNCARDIEQSIVRGVKNVGEILLGQFTPFTAANYAIGVTAVLPTSGYAKSISGITAKDMIKISTLCRLDRAALEQLRGTIREIGKFEGLPSHVQAVESRFKN